MKTYSDKELRREINTLDFGIVSAGDTKQCEVFVHNDTKAWLREIKFKVEHPEVRVISAPTELESGDSGVLILEWRPSVTLKEGLSEVKLFIEAQELWR